MKNAYLPMNVLLVSILMAAAISPVSAEVLNIPERFQLMDQWCWAGTSQAILEYYGEFFTQSEIADYGTEGVNTWNWLYGETANPTRRGIDLILDHFAGITSNGLTFALTQATVEIEIAAGRPFVIRWGWDAGGGHFVDGRGIEGDNVYYMDPWPGEGYQIALYDWVLVGGGHTWTHSLQLTTDPPATPTPTATPPPTPPPSLTPTPTATPQPTPTASPSPSAARRRAMVDNGDYNGDGTDDVAIFRPSSGLWSVREITWIYFGSDSDLPVSGDYDGDGTTEIGIFRGTTGLWAMKDLTRIYFGYLDEPVPGDYDGDGCCDVGIFRPNTGLWAVRGVTRTYFGISGDVPVPGDYGGDGNKGIGIFRAAYGLWALKGVSRCYYGSPADTVVPGDYDGDGTWEPAIFRSSSGLWAVRGGSRCFYGCGTDQPVPADYDGDQADDVGIFRESTGLWAVRGGDRVYYGTSGDIPVTR